MVSEVFRATYLSLDIAEPTSPPSILGRRGHDQVAGVGEVDAVFFLGPGEQRLTPLHRTRPERESDSR